MAYSLSRIECQDLGTPIRLLYHIGVTNTLHSLYQPESLPFYMMSSIQNENAWKRLSLPHAKLSKTISTLPKIVEIG